jgi:hypothetical protein
MKRTTHKVQALEINATMVGALFTDRQGDRLRVFCFYLNGDTGQFDVPADENSDSLHSLFAKLDMVDQCTSIILEKVVRGRVYAEREGNLHSYTLLSTPGDVLPPLNAEICDLPWKIVWSSQEAEVLRLVGVGRAAHCYAIRSPVNDVDAPALYRSSNAFVNPVSVTEKISSPNHWVRQAVAAALLALAVGMGWWLGYRTGKGVPVEHVMAREVKNLVTVPETKAQMLANRAITGPFTLAELARLNTEGKIPAEAMFRVEGSTEWVPLRDMPWTKDSTAPAAKP